MEKLNGLYQFFLSSETEGIEKSGEIVVTTLQLSTTERNEISNLLPEALNKQMKELLAKETKGDVDGFIDEFTNTTKELNLLKRKLDEKQKQKYIDAHIKELSASLSHVSPAKRLFVESLIDYAKQTNTILLAQTKYYHLFI